MTILKIYRKYGLNGFLKKKINLATETSMFLKRDFKKRKRDIVYVTANPFVDMFLRLFLYGNMVGMKNMVLCYHKKFYKFALYALKKYPNKRLIIHFLQPHFPSIRYNFNDYSVKTLRNFMMGKIINKHKNTPKFFNKTRDNISFTILFVGSSKTTENRIHQ